MIFALIDLGMPGSIKIIKNQIIKTTCLIFENKTFEKKNANLLLIPNLITSNATTNTNLYSSLFSKKVFDQFEVNAIKNALLIIEAMFKKRII